MRNANGVGLTLAFDFSDWIADNAGHAVAVCFAMLYRIDLGVNSSVFIHVYHAFGFHDGLEIAHALDKWLIIDFAVRHLLAKRESVLFSDDFIVEDFFQHAKCVGHVDYLAIEQRIFVSQRVPDAVDFSVPVAVYDSDVYCNCLLERELDDDGDDVDNGDAVVYELSFAVAVPNSFFVIFN